MDKPAEPEILTGKRIRQQRNIANHLNAFERMLRQKQMTETMMTTTTSKWEELRQEVKLPPNHSMKQSRTRAGGSRCKMKEESGAEVHRSLPKESHGVEA